MSRNRIVALVSLVAVVALLSSLATRQQPVSGGGGNDIFVDTTLNNEASDGLCSLREGIIAANTNAAYLGCGAGSGAGTDSITFLLGAQVRTISIVTELPTITESVTIDGGDPKVELRGPGGAIVSGQDGLTITAPNTTIKNLVINSFRDVGVLSTSNTTLLGNYIGTDVTGIVAMPNQGFGVQIHGNGAVIGGPKADTACSGDCNLISGNAKDNILLDIDSTSATVLGNFIGTDITGTVALAPFVGAAGVGVKGDFHTIGMGLPVLPDNPCQGGCNVISGNFNGVWVTAGADTTSIGNNFIGTDPTGTMAVQAGSGIGVRNAGHHTFVGGEPSVPGNLISGLAYGIYAEEDLLFVEHNFIGTNAAGTEAIANSVGVLVLGGATTLIQNGNVISGNSRGVYVLDSSGVSIRDNMIGLAADGESPLGNSEQGVFVTGASTLNSIGQVDGLNEIAFNGDGVRVEGPTAVRNIIGPNSIHDNAGLGIENIDGGNTEFSPPAITFASVAGATGTSCPGCVTQVFSDDDDEGRHYEGQTTADGTGAWTFAPLPGFLLTGPNVTATAMDPLLNTSEFSAPFVIFIPTPTPSPAPTPVVLVQGDINCDGVVDGNDALLVILFEVGIFDGIFPDCPFDLGEDTGGVLWGDVNCDGVVDVLDAFAILYHASGADPTPAPSGCVPIGQPFAD